MLHHNAPVTRQSKRTNSLAFSQTDCHTCTSTGLACDRRRPQCSTCLIQGRKCGRFAIPLSGDDRRIWVNNACSTGAPTTGVQGDMNQSLNDDNNTVSDATLPTNSSSSRHFRFVEGEPRVRKRRRTCPPQAGQRVHDQARREEPLILQDGLDNSARINEDPGLSNIDTVDQVPLGLGKAFYPCQIKSTLSLTRYGLGTRKVSLVDNADFFDSGIIDNIFDLEPQGPPDTEDPDVLALCRTPSFNMTTD